MGRFGWACLLLFLGFCTAPAGLADPPSEKNIDLALRKLDLFRKAAKKDRPQIASDLLKISRALSDDETDRLIEAVSMPNSKVVAVILCDLIANRPSHLKKALKALERIHPDLYQPLVVLTVGRFESSYGEQQAAKKLAVIKDDAVKPFLLKRINDGIKSAESSRRFHLYPSNFNEFMKSLIAVAPDDPETFKAIFDVARTYAENPRARNFSYDNMPVAKQAVILLETFGQRAKQAIPVLRELALDRNGGIREAATAALKKIEP
jgi:hypothetical protein